MYQFTNLYFHWHSIVLSKILPGGVCLTTLETRLTRAQRTESFPYISLLLGRRISFVIPVRLRYKGLLNQLFAVFEIVLRLQSKSARLLQFLFEIALRQRLENRAAEKTGRWTWNYETDIKIVHGVFIPQVASWRYNFDSVWWIHHGFP